MLLFVVTITRFTSLLSQQESVLIRIRGIWILAYEGDFYVEYFIKASALLSTTYQVTTNLIQANTTPDTLHV